MAADISVRDQIEALAARDDLAPVEKSAGIARLRASACYEAMIGAMIPCPIGSADGYLVLDAIEQSGSAVSCWVSVFDDDGGEVEIDPHFVIINPPTLVLDPAGDIEIARKGGSERCREDPAAALEECLCDAVAAHLARGAGR